MKRILLFTLLLTTGIFAWADSGTCGVHINWTAISAIANVVLVIVAILALWATKKEIKLMHSNSKTDIYVRYRARFNINSDLRKVQEYLDNQNNSQNKKGHSPMPNVHQMKVFIQYYEEIGFLIDQNRIDSEILSGPIAMYLLKFDELYNKKEDMHYDLQCDEFCKIVDMAKKNQNIK